jgi:aspartate beta-hydroxylase
LNSNSVQQLFQAACKAQEAQQSRKAISKFESVLALAPTHIEARFRLASVLFQGGAPERAAKELATLVTQSPDNAEIRVRQAQVLSALGDSEGCATALEEAVRIDPANIALQLHHGSVCLEAGNQAAAASAFQRAVIMAPDMASYARDQRVPEMLRKTMQTALATLTGIRQGFVSEALDATASAFPGADLSRLRAACEQCGQVVDGTVPDQKPTLFHLPDLPARGWYDSELLPWIDDVEARYPAIQQELDDLLSSGAAFAPYLPANIAGTSSGSALVGSMEWNSYHFFRDGKEMPSNRAKCPVSAGLVDVVPFPHIRGHSPEIFFSRLRPNTQIEPHFGLMNVRLTVHLALNIPANAGIRVGDETRTWTPGKVLAFDDSFNHEAWNNSDEERIVLIFESWNPDVSEPERFGIEHFFEHRQAWLERFNDDALLPAQGVQPRLEW